MEQFKELFKLLPNNPTDEEIDENFKKIYNKTADGIQDEWLKYIKEKYMIIDIA